MHITTETVRKECRTVSSICVTNRRRRKLDYHRVQLTKYVFMIPMHSIDFNLSHAGGQELKCRAFYYNFTSRRRCTCCS